MSFQLVLNTMTLNDLETTKHVFFTIYATLSTFAPHDVEHGGVKRTQSVTKMCS